MSREGTGPCGFRMNAGSARLEEGNICGIMTSCGALAAEEGWAAAVVSLSWRSAASLGVICGEASDFSRTPAERAGSAIGRLHILEEIQTTMGIEFDEYPGEVGFDGVQADAKMICDFFIGESERARLQDLTFSGTQLTRWIAVQH